MAISWAAVRKHGERRNIPRTDSGVFQLRSIAWTKTRLRASWLPFVVGLPLEQLAQQ